MSPSRRTPATGRSGGRAAGTPGRTPGGTQGRTPGRPPASGNQRWVVLAAAAVGLVVLTLALGALLPGDTESGAGDGEQAVVHAEAACELTTQAEEAAQSGDPDSPFDAAVLLLDRAIIESARAAAADADLAPLDAALQAVHTAGHSGDPARWQTALDEALARCAATTD